MKVENREDVVTNLEQRENNYFSTLMILLGVPLLGYFILNDLLSGRYFVAFICAPIFFLIAVGLPALRRSATTPQKQRLTFNLFYWVFLISVGILIGYLILTEGYSRAPWFYLFPLLSFLILGHKAGLILTTVIFFALITADYLFPKTLPVLIPEIRTRFFVSIILITTISYFLERWRSDYKKALVIALRDAKDSEHRYRNLVDTMREGLVGVDADWKITFVNERFSEMSGYSPDELAEKSFFDLLSAETRAKALIELEKRKIGKTGMYELELVHSDGKTLYILCSPNPSYDADGNYLGGFGVISDITELKISSQKLRTSEEKYKFLAENMGDVVWTLDLELRTTYISPSVEKVFGFSPEERMNQKLEEMVPPQSLDRLMKRFLEELERDQLPDSDPDRTITIEVEYFHRDGSILWMENQVKAIRSEKGEMVGIYGVSRDITERKKAQDALLEEEEKLQEAASKIKQLSGLLPICASCKKIRDDKGYWNQIESYIRDHSEADFSHGMCPECIDKVYGDETWYKKTEE